MKSRFIYTVRKWMPLMVAVLFLFCLTSAAVAEQTGEINIKPPLPVLTVFCQKRLLPVVQRVADDLRRRGVIDTRLKVDRVENLLDGLKKNPLAADVLIVEGKESVTVAVRSGLILEEDVVTLASDRLVLAAEERHKGKDPVKLLNSASPGRILLCDPDKSFAGLHSFEALKRTGLASKVSGKILRVDDTSRAVSSLALGKADAAVVYLSDVIQQPGVTSIMTFPKHSYFAILYFGAPIASGSNSKNAKAFLLTLASQQSAEAWIAGGFSPAPKGMP